MQRARFRSAKTSLPNLEQICTPSANKTDVTKEKNAPLAISIKYAKQPKQVRAMAHGVI
jgi:hypothetical protein